MIRKILAALGAALLLAAPAAAQTLSSPGFAPPVAASCGTVTVSTPCLDLTQTWNNGGTTFTAIKLNVTNTSSGSNSLLLDLQRNGSSQFSVGSTGTTTFGDPAAAHLYTSASSGLTQTFNTGGFGWSSGASANGTADVILRRDAANTLALRNGTSAQAFAIYNTYTDASNYERGLVYWNANTFTISTSNVGTGAVRALGFGVSGSEYWRMIAGGHLVASTDNTTDIGASGANRPRNIYVAGAISLAGDLNASNGTGIAWATASILKGSANGALRWTKSDNSVPTVAGLPTCNAAADSARSFVTDATTTTFAGALTGGGANHVPVYCDGGASAWKIGALDLPARLSPANDNLIPDGLLRAFG